MDLLLEQLLHLKPFQFHPSFLMPASLVPQGLVELQGDDHFLEYVQLIRRV